MKIRKLLAIVLTMALAVTALMFNVSAASSVKLNAKSISITVGETYQLELQNAKSSVKWTSSDKSIATVSKGKVTGKKAGKCTISAKCGKSTYKCVVKVNNKTTVGKDVSALKISFSEKIPNDTTGNWRLAKTAKSADMSKYAVSYYNTYFKNDDEIHFVVNSADKTTTSISCGFGTLYVSVYSYVKGEENDANKLPSGDLIAEYGVDMETGKVEKY